MTDANLRSLAAIVTYNPVIDRFRENISRLSEQISYIVVVDNGSDNIRDIEKIVSSFDAVCLKNKKNLGISQALAQIMAYGNSNNFDWVLTLDQDSVIMPGLVKAYEKAALCDKNRDVAMFTCLIKDRNFIDVQKETQNDLYEDVELCITSAAYTNVKKYFAAGGYDVFFFIDCVDFDMCYSLREKGFRICRVNFTGLLHEVGHGENKKLLGREIVVYHQNTIRIYYLARNTVLMSRKHRKMMPRIVMLKKLLYQLLRIVAFERPVSEKLRSFIYGIKDANSVECRKRYH